MTALEQMILNYSMKTGLPLEHVLSGFIGAIKGGLQGVSVEPPPLRTFPFKDENYLTRPKASVSTYEDNFSPVASVKKEYLIAREDDILAIIEN